MTDQKAGSAGAGLVWDALQRGAELVGETALAPAICIFISSDEQGAKTIASFSVGLGRNDEEDNRAFISMLEQVIGDFRGRLDAPV